LRIADCRKSWRISARALLAASWPCAHGHLPLAVIDDAEIHPEAAPSPIIASAFDLQAIEH